MACRPRSSKESRRGWRAIGWSPIVTPPDSATGSSVRWKLTQPGHHLERGRRAVEDQRPWPSREGSARDEDRARPSQCLVRVGKCPGRPARQEERPAVGQDTSTAGTRAAVRRGQGNGSKGHGHSFNGGGTDEGRGSVIVGGCQAWPGGTMRRCAAWRGQSVGRRRPLLRGEQRVTGSSSVRVWAGRARARRHAIANCCRRSSRTAKYRELRAWLERVSEGVQR